MTPTDHLGFSSAAGCRAGRGSCQQRPPNFTSRIFYRDVTETKCTAPIKPDGSNDAFGPYGEKSVIAIFTAPGWRSSIRRFTQRFVTWIEIWFAPGMRSPLMSLLKGVFHAMPASLPLTVTAASSLTSPRSSQICAPVARALAGNAVCVSLSHGNPTRIAHERL